MGDPSDLSVIRTQAERIAVDPNVVPTIPEEEMGVYGVLAVSMNGNPLALITGRGVADEHSVPPTH